MKKQSENGLVMYCLFDNFLNVASRKNKFFERGVPTETTIMNAVEKGSGRVRRKRRISKNEENLKTNLPKNMNKLSEK